MKLERTMYLDAIKNALKTEGIKVADKMNKLALEQKAISTDLYLEAAKLIVKAYLA